MQFIGKGDILVLNNRLQNVFSKKKLISSTDAIINWGVTWAIGMQACVYLLSLVQHFNIYIIYPNLMHLQTSKCSVGGNMMKHVRGRYFVKCFYFIFLDNSLDW